MPLAIRIMDGTVTADEQHIFARRLIDVTAKLKARAAEPWVINGDTTTDTGNAANGTAAHREP